MKKKVIVKRIKEILTKKHTINCKADIELKQLEDINELFEEETEDQIKLCKARNISSNSGLYSLCTEVSKKWTILIKENQEFKWLVPRIIKFLTLLPEVLKEKILKSLKEKIIEEDKKR